jgi:hypothetical protein
MNLGFGRRQALVATMMAGLVAFSLASPLVGSEAQAAGQTINIKQNKDHKVSITDPDVLPQPQVAVVPGSVINLLSRSSKIPIAIKNDYPSPVRIRVVVQASNLKVLIPAIVEVLVPANTTVTAQVPVTAIGDGDVVLHTTLETFSGLRLTTPVDLQMKVILGVEDAVVFAFSGFVVLLGAIGAIRTVRKNRRDKAVAEPGENLESKSS